MASELPKTSPANFWIGTDPRLTTGASMHCGRESLTSRAVRHFSGSLTLHMTLTQRLCWPMEDVLPVASS